MIPKEVIGNLLFFFLGGGFVRSSLSILPFGIHFEINEVLVLML
jgi:hypothetical protein